MIKKKHKKCVKCRVPLEGPGSTVARLIFRVKPSKRKKGHCNKCE